MFVIIFLISTKDDQHLDELFGAIFAKKIGKPARLILRAFPLQSSDRNH